MEIDKDPVAVSSTPLVLAILADGDSYGYAILKRVRELSGGRLEWSDGMLYPILHRLENLGFIESRWGESQSGRLSRQWRALERSRPAGIYIPSRRSTSLDRAQIISPTRMKKPT